MSPVYIGIFLLHKPIIEDLEVLNELSERTHCSILFVADSRTIVGTR